MEDTHEVDDLLIEGFNAAGAQARAGRHQKALAGYRDVLASAGKGLAASREFLATARMRAGFCLMDLDRAEESLQEFAEARKHREALSIEARYELAFATGNALGSLGRLKECYSALIEAVSLAEDMEDYSGRPARCWINILDHGARAGDRAFVAEKAAIALNNARLRGMAELEAVARRHQESR